MADILLHGMEMPTEQRIEALIFKNGFVSYYDVEGRYIGQAKAVPLPAGHGRLGDLETAEAILHNKTFDLAGTSAEYNALNWALRQIKALPTIVPAEGGNADGNP